MNKVCKRKSLVGNGKLQKAYPTRALKGHKPRIISVPKQLIERLYTQLVDFENDDYVSKVANTTEETRKPVEAGFEYVCTSTREPYVVF